jgi:uncharacterized membrane protein YheB (UPF0754 family)
VGKISPGFLAVAYPAMPDLFSHPDFWKYASIPVVAGVVGWLTNWIAVLMTFHPLEFVGLPPWLGWQGIIPSKARKMAATFVDSTMSRLGKIPELFREMEPRLIAEHIVDTMEPRLDELTDEIMLRHNPVLWENLPAVVRKQVYTGARRALSRHVHELIDELAENVEDVLDFKHMITERLESDKELLNRLFLESGDAEFRFIIRSGFWFGLLFGLAQLAVWVFYPRAWVLPVFGLLVGYATNWIALNIIFRPLKPRRLGPWTIQGLFLKRQQEVARVWCRLVTREILTLPRLVHEMLHGPRSARTHTLIHRHMKPLVDEAVGLVKGAAQVTVGVRGFAEIKRTVGHTAVAVSEDPFLDREFNEERARAIEQLLRRRMEALPSEEFQDLLRPCFQEDEWKLILLGAALGFAAGVAQLVFVFGGV